MTKENREFLLHVGRMQALEDMQKAWKSMAGKEFFTGDEQRMHEIMDRMEEMRVERATQPPKPSVVQ